MKSRNLTDDSGETRVELSFIRESSATITPLDGSLIAFLPMAIEMISPPPRRASGARRAPAVGGFSHCFLRREAIHSFSVVHSFCGIARSVSLFSPLPSPFNTERIKRASIISLFNKMSPPSFFSSLYPFLLFVSSPAWDARCQSLLLPPSSLPSDREVGSGCRRESTAFSLERAPLGRMAPATKPIVLRGRRFRAFPPPFFFLSREGPFGMGTAMEFPLPDLVPPPLLLPRFPPNPPGVSHLMRGVSRRDRISTLLSLVFPGCVTTARLSYSPLP